MRIITPAVLLVAFVAGCLDEAPQRKPQPTNPDGKGDNGGLVPVPGEEPPPGEDDSCGADVDELSQKRADGECVPPAE